ncbi:MAG: GNAT family N-acetyltransferase [Acidimicrobiia bacterium]
MDLELRPITEEEYPAFYRAVSTAFGGIPRDEDLRAWGKELVPDRTLAVFDDGDIVATAGAHSFHLTVPGGARVPAAGVTVVGVHPTHRRRGLLVRMMDEQLDDIARRGEPLAVLTASESSIYGRFGYGMATFSVTWELATEGTTLDAPASTPGRLRLVDRTVAAELVGPIYETVASTRVGEVGRSDEWWRDTYVERDNPSPWNTKPFFTVIHEDAMGRSDGFARYSIDSLWPHGRPAGTLHLHELVAVNGDADAALLEYLVNVDLVAKIVAGDRPVDDPLRHRLTDPRRLEAERLVDHLWVRIVDVGTAMSARTYSVDDALVLELVDSFRPANGGRWLVEGGPDGAQCARTDRDADLVMSAADLGALYLGGVDVTTLVQAGRVEERTGGAVTRADRFFRHHPSPWCTTHF